MKRGVWGLEEGCEERRKGKRVGMVDSSTGPLAAGGR
jgi:hypothetical protein